MKEKLSSALGAFGEILYFIFRMFISVLPLVMIGGGWFLRLVIFTIMYFVPVSGIIFWVWGLVCAIGGTQDWVAIVYYICFAVIFLPFFISCALSLIRCVRDKIRPDADSDECTPSTNVGRGGARPKPWLVAAISVLAILSLSANVYQYMSSRSMNGELAKAAADFASMRDKYNWAYSMYQEEKSGNNLISENYSFWRRYARIVSENSSVYHIYPDCKECDTSYFWIYNVEQARDLGYSLCSTCKEMRSWKD